MNKILNMIDILAADSTSATSNTGSNNSSIWVYVILIGLVVLMLVLPMITQRKRNKEYTEMLSNLNVGDTVKTIGGVIGRINKIQEKDGVKTFILETGAKGSKTTMEFDIAAIGYVLNSTKKVVEPKQEEKNVEEVKEEVPVVSEEKVEETPVTQTVEKAPAKKTTAKKTTTKKSTTKKASK